MEKNYNLSFKKNDIEKLLLNLDQNPYSQKNKDFRFTLSLIYELVEEEFADTFDTKNPILRQTEVSLNNEENNASIFITPPYSFDYYLKQKGSLYRLRPEYKGSEYGYKINLNMFFEYSFALSFVFAAGISSTGIITAAILLGSGFFFAASSAVG